MPNFVVRGSFEQKGFTFFAKILLISIVISIEVTEKHVILTRPGQK